METGWYTVKEPVEDPNLPHDMHDAEDRHSAHHVLYDLFHSVHKQGRNHSGKPYIQEHGFDVPVKWTHLVKRPVVRQWIHQSNLYKEKDERLPSRFELFFDLMFVGIAHVVAEGATEEATGFNLLKFVLEYFPTWSFWMDVRTFLNVSGTDDLKERMGLLASMVLLAGYAGNASALSILEDGTPEEVFKNGGAAVDSDWTGDIGRMRHCKPGNIKCQELGYYLGNGYWLKYGYQDAVHSAVAFYLVMRLFHILLHVYYGWRLPSFRLSMWTQAIVRSVISVIYIPIMFVWSPALIVILMFVGMVLELLNAFLVLYIIKFYHSLSKRWNKTPLYIPALSMEHVMERTIQFVIVVVGEMIISATYSASKSKFGLSIQYGQSALGICCSFMIIWLYYDADSSRTFQHALRRHAIPATLFSMLHFPLTAALILAGASLKNIVQDDNEVMSGGYLWFWSGSLCVTLCCIGLIGLLHRNLDMRNSTLLPRWTRIGWRFVCALIILFLPLMRENWETINLLGVDLSILFALVVFETISKLGAVGRHYDAEKAGIVRRAKSQSAAATDPKLAESIQHARQELYDMGAMSPHHSEAIITAPTKRFYLSKSIPWHPYDGLTMAETGEEDVGMEGELGHLETKELSSGQRWAYTT